MVHLHQSGLSVDRRQHPSALHFDQFVLRLAVIVEMVPVRRRQLRRSGRQAETLDFGTMKFAPNCGPLITSFSSASWARQNDAAKIDITPHKISRGKIVFMSLSWNAEAETVNHVDLLAFKPTLLRVRALASPAGSTP